jgi:hypothetical protein
MKTYTDLEQSKKLAEILPLESADMWFANGIIVARDSVNEPDDIQSVSPCWSLAALLGVIPEPDLVQNSEGTWLIRSWVNAYPWSVGGYSNPVDACYELILKLHEQNLL